MKTGSRTNLRVGVAYEPFFEVAKNESLLVSVYTPDQQAKNMTNPNSTQYRRRNVFKFSTPYRQSLIRCMKLGSGKWPSTGIMALTPQSAFVNRLLYSVNLGYLSSDVELFDAHYFDQISSSIMLGRSNHVWHQENQIWKHMVDNRVISRLP